MLPSRPRTVDFETTLKRPAAPSKPLARAARTSQFTITMCIGSAPWQGIRSEESNKAMVRTSFERWKSGIGGPFELLAPDAEWTIVGASPLARTYHSKKEFIDAVIKLFNARMSSPLVPTVRGIFADGDTVIILFDAETTVSTESRARRRH